MKDPFSVFQSVANTPAYHKKGKMEMMARLDNQGPFHIFYTVSCADTRWKENIVYLLQECGKNVRCMIDNQQMEIYEVFSISKTWITLETYMEKEMSESQVRLRSPEIFKKIFPQVGLRSSEIF